MNHIFLYALPTNQSKDARILEISAVRVEGFGPYKKSHVQKAFTGSIGEYSPAELLRTLKKEIEIEGPYVIVSHGCEVAKALLRIETEKYPISLFQGKPWKDIHQLAWPLSVSEKVGTTIQDLSKHFDVDYKDSSDSADTVTAIMQIYGLLMRRYRTALHGEAVVREAGGETLANLRTMIGF